MDIFFATSNIGKIRSMERYLAPLGFQLQSAPIDFVEPQSDSIEDIARAKAQEAYARLKAPVIVQDTGFSIPALNGFPGPYAKYANDTLGAAGYLRLMQGVTDRRCHFTGVIAFADEKGDISLFSEQGPRGTIATVQDDQPLLPQAWSVLWQVYIPEGQDKPLNAMSDTEREAWYAHSRGRSHFDDFAGFLAGLYPSVQRKAV